MNPKTTEAETTRPAYNEMMSYVIEFHGCDLDGDLPDTMKHTLAKVMQEAHIAYVRSRRDPDAARLVFLKHLPTLVEALEDNLCQSLQWTITNSARRLREARAAREPFTPLNEDDSKQLRMAQAIRRWLYGM